MPDLKSVGEFLKTAVDHLAAIGDPIGLSCLFAIPIISTLPVEKYPAWLGHTIGGLVAFMLVYFVYSLFYRNSKRFRLSVDALLPDRQKEVIKVDPSPVSTERESRKAD